MTPFDQACPPEGKKVRKAVRGEPEQDLPYFSEFTAIALCLPSPSTRGMSAGIWIGISRISTRRRTIITGWTAPSTIMKTQSSDGTIRRAS